MRGQKSSPEKGGNSQATTELETICSRILTSKYSLKINYDFSDLFDFAGYKASLSDLLTEFFEDIITTEDKIKFVEFAMASQLTDAGKYPLYLSDLRNQFDAKVFSFLETIKMNNLISSRAVLTTNFNAPQNFNQKTATSDKELNLEYLVGYIRTKMGQHIKDINQYFFKANPSQNDTKLCGLLHKLLKLISYFEGTNEQNVINRVTLD